MLVLQMFCAHMAILIFVVSTLTLPCHLLTPRLILKTASIIRIIIDITQFM